MKKLAILLGFMVALALALPPPGPTGAAFPGANGKIAFASQRDAGLLQIYVMNADGSGQTNLSSSPNSNNSWPSWSPDGLKIAFNSTRDGNNEIYVMNADGSGQTRLTNNPALDEAPSWSPDGSQLAFFSFRDGNAEIYVMNADGSGQIRLTNNLATDWFPAWSPNGSQIAFGSDRDGSREIYVMNADGSGQTRLTNDPGLAETPSWSPNGSQIVFYSTRDGNAEIYVMNADGTGQTNLTNHPDSDADPAWSPDGFQIAFGSTRDGNPEIYVMNADGSGQTRLTNDPASDGSPDWQPLPPPELAVVLVHGYDGNNEENTCGMDSLQTWLSDAANTGGENFQVYCFIYRSREGVRAAAGDLARLIADVPNADEVDIVAHSMGGLVARYYIEKLGNQSKVRSLTMLGTPNWGTPIAIPPCTWALLPFTTDDQGACDLVPLSPLIRDLNFSPGSYQDVSYQVITGWIGPPGVLSVPNDCVVEVSSAIGLLFPLRLRPVSHVDRPLAGCVGTAIMDSTSVRQEIANILLASNGAAGQSQSANPAGAMTLPPDEPAASSVAIQGGLIAQGEIVDLAVAMPAAQASATFVFSAPSSAGVTLTFSLIRPDGTAVLQSDGDTTVTTGSGFGPTDEMRYAIASPASGDWTMRVSGISVPQDGWPYDLQSLVPGAITVTASADAGHYDTGESIILSAEVLINDLPLLSATVAATVIKPDNTTSEVPLTSDGFGKYVGTFSDTAACGLYQVVVTATGVDGTTPFTRLARTLAIVGVPGNVILDPCSADSDADGLTDQDELDLFLTNPARADTDGDGCIDGVELGSDQTLGGGRDPLNFWDFFDPNRDRAVGLLDFLAVLRHFGTVGDPSTLDLDGPEPPPGEYWASADRGGQAPGGDPWDELPANGSIGLTDFLSVLRQFGHTCA